MSTQGTRRKSNADIQATQDAVSANSASGNWTPTLAFGTNGTAVLTTTWAKYVREGKMVTVNANFSVTKGTATGGFMIGGLPFAPSNDTMGSLLTNTGNLTMPTNHVAKVRANTFSQIEFIRVLTTGNEGLQGFLVGDLPVGSVNFTVTFTYIID